MAHSEHDWLHKLSANIGSMALWRMATEPELLDVSCENATALFIRFAFLSCSAGWAEASKR
jgi:hypothetical protein